MTILRVLHVEDDPSIREVTEISLGLDPDLVTRTCGSGREALAVVADWIPDVILLDVMMPVMDGPTTLAHLRDNALTANIPVVFMTARAQASEIALFRSLGAAGVIPKPFDPMSLAALVRAFAQPVDNQLVALSGRFLRRLDDDAAVLSLHQYAIKSNATAAAALAGIVSVAHSLAGAGGLFGFSDIGDAAAALEEAVIVQRDGTGTLEGVASAIDLLLARIRVTRSVQKHPSHFQLGA